MTPSGQKSQATLFSVAEDLDDVVSEHLSFCFQTREFAEEHANLIKTETELHLKLKIYKITIEEL